MKHRYAIPHDLLNLLLALLKRLLAGLEIAHERNLPHPRPIVFT